MTPKEKAAELYNKCNPHCKTKSFYGDDIERQSTKQCALIAVEELIQGFAGSGIVGSSAYWKEVKQEIELF